jgi:hypothetical protein
MPAADQRSRAQPPTPTAPAPRAPASGPSPFSNRHCADVSTHGCEGASNLQHWLHRTLESVLFIGTQFSILYTFVYSPA